MAKFSLLHQGNENFAMVSSIWPKNNKKLQVKLCFNGFQQTSRSDIRMSLTQKPPETSEGFRYRRFSL